MAHRGKPPPPERNWAPPLWFLLSPEERKAMRRTFGLPDRWAPPPEPSVTLEQRIERLDELGRIMQMPPGRIAQWKQELIDRNQPEEKS